MSGTITPSPAAAFATTALSDAERADIRRFSGYPPYGQGASGFSSWRFFQAYGLAEYRMTNMAPAELQNLRYLVTQLYTLESAVWGASSNLDTDQAAVWTHNKREVADREHLFGMHRRRLATLLGVPPGPDLKSGNSFDVVV
jgi:hypothetical protein